MSSIRHPGIRLKITLAFAMVFTLLSVGLNLYIYQRIRLLIIGDNNRYLLSKAVSLLQKTEVNPVIIPLPDKNTSIKVFYRSSGKKLLLFQSPGLISRIPLPARPGVIDTLGLRVAYVANNSDDNPAELLLATSDKQLRATLRYLLLLLILSSLVSVVISGIVSFWLAKFFLWPVQKIIQTTQTINAGQLRERVPVKETKDELQQLTETINAMLERIERSLQQQQNFFASASHELKTPLAVMRTEIEVKLRQGGVSQEFKQFMYSQLEEINRLQLVVQEFLLISQIKEEKLSIQAECFDLSELCIKISNQLGRLAEDKNQQIKLKFDRETESFEVFADKEKIRIVLLNLLENAIKYSLPGKPINMCVGNSDQQSGIELSIENAAIRQHTDISTLTCAYYQGDVLQGGAGIGLWLCSEILLAHQKQLHLSSNDHYFKARFRLRNCNQK